VDETLIVWRAVHFAATIQVAGILIFRAFILPAGAPARLYRLLLRVFWVSLAVALVSGAAWFCAVSAAIDGTSWTTALTDGTGGMVLTGTQFGKVWLVRFVAGVLLAGVLLTGKTKGFSPVAMELALAAIFAGGLAFAGHAASTPGAAGNQHLTADIVHILAASTWLGGLVPLALYLWSWQAGNGSGSIAGMYAMTRRFSNLGIGAVLAIAVSGVINASNLVGSAALLTHTAYGRLLLIKVTIFTLMVVIAIFNRFSLAQHLDEASAIAALRRNTLIEAALGALILVIVAALGTMPPALLDHMGMQH